MITRSRSETKQTLTFYENEQAERDNEPALVLTSSSEHNVMCITVYTETGETITAELDPNAALDMQEFVHTWATARKEKTI